MKTVTIYSISILFGIITLFSCQEAQEKEREFEEAPRDGSYVFQLTEQTAKARINRYAEYVDELSDSLVDNESAAFRNSKSILAHGAEVELVELRRILRWSDSLESLGEVNRIYTMTGIKGTKESGHAEVIFCLESYKEEADTTLLFFNFTRPCPTSCPSWMPPAEL
ncbi:MAG: hypothetical protein P8P74_01765 [Crocinitomicaceae bacterium]|nr:hypothetical protein [Crocinitomicaceae bacterium]